MTVVDDIGRRFDHSRFMDWRIRVNPETGVRELLVGDLVGAVAMRAGLGAETNSALAVHMLSGPVLGYPGTSEEWVFLTGPAGSSLRLATLLDLGRIGVRLLPRQTWLPLPPDVGRWVVPPLPGQTLPPWQFVLGAVRSTSSLHTFRGR
ncbi:hypothetical protein JOF53_000964 [Crossiella equi]|uniref:Uncharacterized protein n=1 Tax=Crossiella equi TaxID=130796 RepID=A0ABS5A753_9PSEU|nr:hypothetical protein [Crossiella equi]MBP2472092.1 hypothetical protein [Crossiella equi]